MQQKINIRRDKGFYNQKIALVIIMLIIIFILSVFSYSNIVDYLSTYEKREVYAQIIVSNNFGIAINGSSMIFGMTVPGGTSRKEIQLENNYKHDVRFKIYSEGNISDFLIISENNFILKPMERKTLTFTVKVPKNANFGTYDGKIFFIIKNPVLK